MENIFEYDRFDKILDNPKRSQICIPELDAGGFYLADAKTKPINEDQSGFFEFLILITPTIETYPKIKPGYKYQFECWKKEFEDDDIYNIFSTPINNDIIEKLFDSKIKTPISFLIQNSPKISNAIKKTNTLLYNLIISSIETDQLNKSTPKSSVPNKIKKL